MDPVHDVDRILFSNYCGGQRPSLSNYEEKRTLRREDETVVGVDDAVSAVAAATAATAAATAAATHRIRSSS